jgi:hypothetical protein
MMAIDINLILSVEKLRDGGSLAVLFQGNDSCEYMFMLPIKNAGQDFAGYLDPVLINRTTELFMKVNSNDAKVYLGQLKSYAVNEKQISFINLMINLVCNE